MIGHTMSHSKWKQAVEPQKQEVIRQMTEYKFPFMGKERSMGDYYEGYGWAGTITLILMAVILWIVPEATAETKQLSLKIALTVTLSLLAWCMMEFLYFFPFAASMTLLAATLSLLGVWQLRNPDKI